LRRTTAEAARRRRRAVITDLDGCLLDAQTYELGPARAALAQLRRQRVPLVLCTSKTRLEVADLFSQLGGPCLAVVEDGGGLLIPPGSLPRGVVRGARRTRHGRLVTLAASYRVVRRVFAALRRGMHGALTGFGDLDLGDIVRLTGLAPAAARRAARREFDEPFVITRDRRRTLARVRRHAARHGLLVTAGGRFHHLHGDSDKGRATQLVRALLERAGGPLTLIALGDSALDAPMLAAADVPIVVPRPDGRSDPALRRRVPHARIAPAAGPAGWAAAVRRAIGGW
jgi:mannosyl-3-phosphoglycerate phosphatase